MDYGVSCILRSIWTDVVLGNATMSFPCFEDVCCTLRSMRLCRPCWIQLENHPKWYFEVCSYNKVLQLTNTNNNCQRCTNRTKVQSCHWGVTICCNKPNKEWHDHIDIRDSIKLNWDSLLNSSRKIRINWKWLGCNHINQILIAQQSPFRLNRVDMGRSSGRSCSQPEQISWLPKY